MKLKSALFATILASAMGIGIANAQSDSLTPAQKTEIEGIVKNYIIQNPDIIAQAIQSLQKKQMDQMRDQGQAAAAKNAPALFNQSNDPVAGNASGKVTVVEFFDYQCPHCVDMAADIKALISSNPNVRVVFKEFPIRGPVSLYASKAALAANKQGKYVLFHDALMKNADSLTEEKILNLAKEVGLDTQKLQADMNSPEIDKQIKATYELAKALNLYGTPAVFIAKTNVSANAPATAIVFIPGQVDKKYLEGEINKIQ